MNVFIPSNGDRAITRIINALKRYAPPSVAFVPREEAADLVVIFVTGAQDRTRKTVERLTSRGQRYAIVQICLRSTKRPHTRHWRPIWHGAELVWSWLDLNGAMADDGEEDALDYYFAPLGVDDAFQGAATKDQDASEPEQRTYLIATSGLNWFTESIRECASAAARVNRRVFNLGPELYRPIVECYSGISDQDLAHSYSQCDFVSGLRRKEGFELPAAEGLCCGARPILFDTPGYRRWYEPWGLFIPERSRDEVIASLVALFRQGPNPAKDHERREAAERFDWATIIPGFWSRL